MNFYQLSLLLETDIKAELQALNKKDQDERNYYKDKYLMPMGGAENWRQAAAAFCKDMNRDPEDVFDEKGKAAEVKNLIKTNIDAIMADPEAVKMAWRLVQHMDYDIPFQQWFFKFLSHEKHKEEYTYLYDRIAIKTGQPQKFNTQTD